MRSAIVLRIDPEAVDKVLKILKAKKDEFLYDKERGLSIFIKKLNNQTDEKKWFLSSAIIDTIDRITYYKREGEKIVPQINEFKTCIEVKYAYFSSIKGSGEIQHGVIVFGREYFAKLFSTAIEKIIDRNAFLRVKFIFTSGNEVMIRNQFDDIIRIKSENILDAVISGMYIKGTRLYDAEYEYQKTFTGNIKIIGVVLGNNLFLLNSLGKITTYKKLTDEEFIQQIEKILSRLLSSNAILLS